MWSRLLSLLVIALICVLVVTICSAPNTAHKRVNDNEPDDTPNDDDQDIVVMHIPFDHNVGSAYIQSIGYHNKLRHLFDAIWMIESSRRLNPPKGKFGEIGPYQITYAYWKDARVPGSFHLCMNKNYAERVMIAYWHRYGAKTDEQRARMHNGGPRGPYRRSTLRYWKKVRNIMMDGS